MNKLNGNIADINMEVATVEQANFVEREFSFNLISLLEETFEQRLQPVQQQIEAEYLKFKKILKINRR